MKQRARGTGALTTGNIKRFSINRRGKRIEELKT